MKASSHSKKISFFRGVTILLFIIVVFWWIILQLFVESDSDYPSLLWAASYQILALMGAVGGFFISRSWGGIKSLMGKSIIFFSSGLLFQVFGQSAFSFYNLFLKVEIPYPSVADIGFLGSTICYIIGAFYLAKVISVHISLKILNRRLQAIVIPAIILIVSYFFFLRGYAFDWSSPLKIFLDLGYPLGDAMYISLALVTLLLARNFLGGIMKWPVLVILFALIAQYIADFNFLYQASNLTWVNGGYGDLLYACSYFITSLSLLGLGTTFKKIKES